LPAIGHGQTEGRPERKNSAKQEKFEEVEAEKKRIIPTSREIAAGRRRLRSEGGGQMSDKD